MWIYEKKLQFPVKITRPDARMAKIMIEQYGGTNCFRISLFSIFYFLLTYCQQYVILSTS